MTMVGDALVTGGLKVGQFLGEDTYGTMKTGQLGYAGDTLDLQPLPGNPFGTTFEHIPGDQVDFFVDEDIFQGGFTRKYRMRSGEYWKNYCALYGYGSTSGLPSASGQHLGQFTFLDDVYDGTTHAYQVFNGCKFNKLMISGRRPKAAILFEDEVFSQWYQNDSDKNLTGIQTVTLGADAGAVSSDKLIWAGNSQINLAGGGLNDWYLENWKITQNNNLFREPGVKTGGDSNPYYVPMGLNEDGQEVIFEGEVIVKDMTYINAKINKTVVTAITIPIDDDLITLTGGTFTRDDFPPFSQKSTRERIKVRFTGLAITTP